MIRLLYTAEKRWFGVIVRKVEGSVGLCRIRVYMTVLKSRAAWSDADTATERRICQRQ